MRITSDKLKQMLGEGFDFGFRSSHRSYPGWPILLVVLILGAIIGGWLGEILTGLIPALKEVGRVYTMGIPRLTLGEVLTLLGLTIRIGLFGVFGMLAAFLCTVGCKEVLYVSLILASRSSPRRRLLLESLGLKFEVIPRQVKKG